MPRPPRQRIDSLLVYRGLAESRTRAGALVLAGKVFAAGQRVEKAGTMLPADISLEVRGEPDNRVSRGAYKLSKGLDFFNISPLGLVCVDIGASTGGFTQVLLERGALKVYAVDVGYGQLAWSLRQDGRVVVMERKNARELTGADFEEVPALAVVDVSFISLKLLLPALRRVLSPSGQAVLLVKPQFEVGKGRVGKGGVVKSKEDHADVLRGIIAFMEQDSGFFPAGLTFSPITGPMGNIEYLLHAVRFPVDKAPLSPEAAADEAHRFFAEGRTSNG